MSLLSLVDYESRYGKAAFLRESVRRRRLEYKWEAGAVWEADGSLTYSDYIPTPIPNDGIRRISLRQQQEEWDAYQLRKADWLDAQ
jgi:hypothetical protein